MFLGTNPGSSYDSRVSRRQLGARRHVSRFPIVVDFLGCHAAPIFGFAKGVSENEAWIAVVTGLALEVVSAKSNRVCRSNTRH
jgi:hypothetical protein